MISIYTRLTPDNTKTLLITLEHQRRQVNQRVHLEAIRCRLTQCKISETTRTCKQMGDPAALRMYIRRTTGRYTRIPAEREKTENCPYPFEKKNPRSEKTLKDTLSLANIHWKCQDVNKQSFYMWEIYSRFLVSLCNVYNYKLRNKQSVPYIKYFIFIVNQFLFFIPECNIPRNNEINYLFKNDERSGDRF